MTFSSTGVPGCVICLLITLLGVTNTNGQNQLNTLRNYPPGVVSKGETGLAVTTLRWRLKQQAALQQAYKMSREKLSARLEAYDKQVAELSQSLPTSIRFLDAGGRSATTDWAAKQLLEAQLQLVSLESMVRQLELSMAQKADEPTDGITSLKQETEIKTAKLRMDSEKANIQKLQMLVKRGFTNNAELVQAKHAYEIAKAEYELEVQTKKLSRAAGEIAQQLSSLRIEIAPIEAKIKTLEDFLQMLDKASNDIARIIAMQRGRKLFEKEFSTISEAIFESDQESLRLRTFLELVEKEQKAGKADAKKEEEGKTDSDQN